MLCEVCYFFCGRTDSYFEENAKDGTISGRNHLRKELVMKVESSSYEAYLEALEEWKQKMQESQAAQQKEENSATDSYVPGISQMDMDIPMPSSTYNAQGMMSGERPPMPPMPPQETEETDETTESTQVTGTTETQGTAATGTEALLEELSETFRANPDSILMKLDELGLSLEDLGDEDNLALLATAMNEGAANMGLPTIEDLDSVVSTLHEKLSANWSSYFEVEEA
ncbi:hypothetical protein RHOM_15985 [Roseburia hominis A2-183]|uniref:Uncharacterized protein n=2 Tax=Roseburia hominis TaxID=301301 RepID=G2T5Z5_ROSHA|nr:hypothetical protein RHOM_15985 [Roseburia hominis A2-183]